MTDKKINKILFITLSNMGDVVLTLPVLDELRALFPDAEITAMVGPRAREVFEGSSSLQRLIIYDKYSPLKKKVALFGELAAMRFDIVIDMRNTLYGAFLPARLRTSPFLMIPRRIRHMKERNLYRLHKALGKEFRDKPKVTEGRAFSYAETDREHVERLLKDSGVESNEKIILVSASAGGDTRRWPEANFHELCRELSKRYRVILIGAANFREKADSIRKFTAVDSVLNYCGLTSLRQLAYLCERSSLLITCDTGTIHIASYMDTSIVALFGPSERFRYGPWSGRFAVVRKEIFCRPCKQAHCRYGSVECMTAIRVNDVIRAVERTFSPHEVDGRSVRMVDKKDYRRILITRTDRIGDVMLSTPVIENLRSNFPYAYIAMMVAPDAEPIVRGNPYLDRVIVYDKKGPHKNWFATVNFSRMLTTYQFELAIMLHPTNRVHLVAFLAGIPRRLGYNRKMGFLLTDRIRHDKQAGQKHELEYNFDLLKALGLEPTDKRLSMTVKADAESWAEEFFLKSGLKEKQGVIIIHPGASCPSKIWPPERFAQTADTLIERYGCGIIVVAGPKDTALAARMVGQMKNRAIDMSGKTSIDQLASLLKRAQLFISNDSGPVHIASSLGTPVISLFGRKQPGLGPKRWGPVGPKDRSLHKDAGCIRCLAHNCVKEFACLKAITVGDVLEAVKTILA